MLHAISQKHDLDFHRRYQGHRDGFQKAHALENEIVSTVLGPLAFLTAAEVGKFWRVALEEAGARAVLSGYFPGGDPDAVSVAFWPKRRSETGRLVEPDLFMEMKWPDQRKLTLLIECKWNAGQSGEDQLFSQWKHFLASEERGDALHIFIGRTIGAGIQAKREARDKRDGKEAWGGDNQARLRLLTWSSLRNVFARLAVASEGHSSLAEWSRLAALFLERIGIQQFAGFKSVESEPPLSHVSRPCFWRPYRGVGHLCPPGELLLPSGQPIFFRSGESL